MPNPIFTKTVKESLKEFGKDFASKLIFHKSNHRNEAFRVLRYVSRVDKTSNSI